MAGKKKGKRKADDANIGTGMAGKAAETLKERRKRNQQQLQDIINGIGRRR